MIGLIGLRLGSIVLYRWPLEDGKAESPSFPALVYKIYSGPDADHGYVGLYVYSDDGIKHYKKVPYHLVCTNCWRCQN